MRILTFILALFLASSALADATPVKVVAVVGDQVISSLDLQDRVYLIMVTTGIPDTSENRAKLTPQILRQLVDEKLQMQDATAANITISDERLHSAIAQIEKQNNKEPGSLEAYIESRGASKTSFYNQVRAQAAWVEIVQKKIRPRIRVSDQEVARYVERRTAAAATGNVGAQEVQIAVIQLPVDSPKNEASVRKVAQKLADEIHSGVSFDAVASQFSSGSGGSAPFWVEASQLDPSISAVLAKTPKGTVTDPLKSGAGYQLIKLVDTRKKPGEGEAAPAATATTAEPRVEYAFRQVVITPKQGEKKNDKTLADIVAAITKTPGPCTDKMVGTASGKDADVNVTFLRRASESLPDNVRGILGGLKVGGVSSPVTTPDAVRLFILCERAELPPQKPSEEPAHPSGEAIRQAIFSEKLELEVQKYMRNLREQGFIEVRGL